MKTSLVSREVIADSIELVARGHLFDAVIALSGLRQDDPRHGHGARPPQRPGGDALRRLDPARALPGPRRHDPGGLRGRRRARRGQDDRRGARTSSRASPAPAPARAAASSPRTRWRWPSRCSASRPMGPSMVPAQDPTKAEVAYERGQARRRRAAARACAAATSSPARRSRTRSPRSTSSGGSTNGVLHLLAVAREAGVELDDRRLRPHQRAHAAALRPQARRPATSPSTSTRPAACRSLVERLRELGVLHERRDHGHRQDRSASIADAAQETAGQRVVRPLDDPIKPTGGLAILRGNLAPEGCVVKLAGHERRHHSGPARVFDGEEAAMDAVTHGGIQRGRRRRHPQRGPGRRPRHARDARASRRRSTAPGSASTSRCSPTGASPAPPTASWPATSRPRRRAAARSPRSRDGDEITIDVDGRRIDVALDDDEIAAPRRRLRRRRTTATRPACSAKYADARRQRLRGRRHPALSARPPAATPAADYSSAANASSSALNARGRSSIATCPVSGQTTLRASGISRSNSSRVAHGHEAVLLAPDDQRRAADLAEARRGSGSRVSASSASTKPGLPAPRSCSARAGPGAGPGAPRRGPSAARRVRGRRASASRARADASRPRRSDQPSAVRAARRGRVVALVLDRSGPAALTSTRRSTRAGNWIASSAAMKPPIELPTTTPRSSSQARRAARRRQRP